MLLIFIYQQLTVQMLHNPHAVLAKAQSRSLGFWINLWKKQLLKKKGRPAQEYSLQKYSTFTRQIVVLFSGRRKIEPYMAYATQQADKIEQTSCVSWYCQTQNEPKDLGVGTGEWVLAYAHFAGDDALPDHEIHSPIRQRLRLRHEPLKESNKDQTPPKD